MSPCSDNSPDTAQRSTGEFKRSSQHLDRGNCDDYSKGPVRIVAGEDRCGRPASDSRTGRIVLLGTLRFFVGVSMYLIGLCRLEQGTQAGRLNWHECPAKIVLRIFRSFPGCLCRPALQTPAEEKINNASKLTFRLTFDMILLLANSGGILLKRISTHSSRISCERFLFILFR